MRTQTLEQEISVEQSEYGQYLDGLAAAAQAVAARPRQRQILEYYIQGNGDAIHRRFGGELEDRGEVYWHHHGTFVAPDGAIYRVRTDDDGIFRVYASPVDSRGDSIDCIQPYVYDGYIGPHAIEMRVDFVNGVHRSVPLNSRWEHELQAREGRDVMTPRHQEGIAFDSRRDSIALCKHPDGHIEGWLHDSADGEVVSLYSPAEVCAMIAILEEEENEDMFILPAAA